MVLSLTHQTLLLKIRVSLDWNFAPINAGPLSSNTVVTLLSYFEKIAHMSVV